jgi:predicted DNA-binding transcriptional regulator AlpA
MQLVGVDEWAARLKVSRRQAELMIGRGQIPRPVRIGKLRRWTTQQIDEWITRQAEAAEAGDPDDRPGRPRKK